MPDAHALHKPDAAKRTNVLQVSRRTLTTEQLAAIGSVAVQSTYCEQWVELVIWVLLGVDAEKGQLLTHNMQMNARLELLQKLGLSVLRGKDAEAFKDVIARLKTANQQRNVIIHGEWRHQMGSGQNMLRFLMVGPDELRPATAMKRKPNGEYATITADKIEGAAQAIAELTAEFVHVVTRWDHLAIAGTSARATPPDEG